MSYQIQSREIRYIGADGTRLFGFFVYPVNVSTPVPGVLVAPEWWGMNDYIKQRATELAREGYAALAMEVYGDGEVTADASIANEWMTNVVTSGQCVTRTEQALQQLAKQPEVDSSRLAAIGFCFGGKLVLDLARAGADLKSVVTFHGNLSPALTAERGQITAEILVLHGEKDSMVTLDDVDQFEKEMQRAEAKAQIIIYPNAHHGFSNPLADARAKANHIDLAYDAEAERASKQAMHELFAKTLL